MSRSWALFALVWLGGACSGTSPGPPSEPDVPSFETVYEEVFVPGLCGDPICHGEQTQGGDLDLRDPTVAYDALLKATAIGPRCQSAGVARIVAFEPESSLLYLKLHRELTPCGQVMPPTAIVLSEGKLALVRAWIEGGARWESSAQPTE